MDTGKQPQQRDAREKIAAQRAAAARQRRRLHLAGRQGGQRERLTGTADGDG